MGFGGLRLQGLSFSALALPGRSEVFLQPEISSAPLQTGGSQRTPETQDRVRAHPHSPGAGPVGLRGGAPLDLKTSGSPSSPNLV